MAADDTTDDEIAEQLGSTLDSLDGAVNYVDWITDMIRPYLAGPLLELGAGHGTFTERFADTAGTVTSVEPDPASVSLLRERFEADERVAVVDGTLESLDDTARFGSAVMINVLEHIEDDRGVLLELHARLEPGGHLAIWVPAFECLYSDFDRRLGHHRRYRLLPLRELVESAGFEVEFARYVNLPGWFSWFLVARLLRQTPSNGPLVRAFDRLLVPPTRWIEDRIRAPFGPVDPAGRTTLTAPTATILAAMIPDRCLSVVMPCFNERATIETIVDAVLDSPFVGELVIVDDWSTDGTWDILAGFDDERSGAVLHDHNQVRVQRSAPGSLKRRCRSSSCRTPTSNTTWPSTHRDRRWSTGRPTSSTGRGSWAAARTASCTSGTTSATRS
ncbi:MAG: methyltransferase [Ilumatobacteraceae bacterium]